MNQVLDPNAGAAAPSAPAADPLAEAAQATATARRGQRLPTEPYPGLRPFLDFEETLLFGRGRQVREVIDRLGQTQFVAVIGGSGSGKSSLILAGVVPELRSFGIPDAGDFWVPMVCTPGTNATAADQAQRSDTPITRLARRFAALLKPRATPEANAARLDEIAGHLRRELGFATLVDLYTPELAVPPGPKAEDARFLFVIDQFEELFHPTNRGVEDGRLLVERVIDHFFSPHRRCYLVLTMRSEHLADCAGFLELPDAINKASYLVRRLDADQLREAISGPAQRLLRIRQRLDDDTSRLPDAVRFDDAVMARLLRDVQAITADPDHLPLLQHLLARLWQAALHRAKARAQQPLDLPDLITPDDLAMAVGAGGAAGAAGAADAKQAAPATPPPPLDPQTNTLRASLENWAQALYLQHPEAERLVINNVLRRLAIKDPNTGMYSQQRLHVDEAARMLRPDATPDDLRRLLAGGFLGQVDYLFWDDDNPERVTLKVSHESFIRGWLHFRGLIDHEAERFEAFIDLLRKCRQWQAQQRDPALLLEANDLKRSDSARLSALLGQPDERKAWFARLAASRDGLLLGPMAAVVDDFLAASQQRQQAAQDKLKKAKQRKVLVWIALLLALPPILFWTLVQGPVVDRAELMFQAMNLAGSAEVRAERPGEATPQGPMGSAADDLQALLDAVGKLDQAGDTGSSLRLRVHQWLLDTLRGMPLVGGQADFVAQMTRVAEPPVNANLRRLLESTVWRAPVGGPGKAGAGDETIKPAVVKPSQTCSQVMTDGSGPGGIPKVLVQGQLITAESPDNPRLARSVFIPDQPNNANSVELMAATLDPTTGACTVAQDLMRLPRTLRPVIAFDANLRHLLYTTTVNDRNEQVATIVQIDWELTDEDGSRTVRTKPRLVLTDPQDAAQLAQAAKAAAASASSPGGAGVLDTRRSVAGRSFTVGSSGWRLFDPQAQRVGEARPKGSAAQIHPGFKALQPAVPGSACQRLAALLPLQSGFVQTAWLGAADGPCYVVSRGKAPEGDGPPDSAGPGAPGAPAAPAASEGPQASPPRPTMQRDEQVLVSVYAQPSDAELRAASAPPAGAAAATTQASAAAAASAGSSAQPESTAGSGSSANQALAPLATLPRFTRVRPGETLTWQVGDPAGPYAGWIGVESPNNSGKLRLVAAPYSTCALWRIGMQVVADQGAPAKADAGTCAGR